MKKVAVIGGGISGLSAACFAAKEGHDVTIYEKNATLGGRARHFSEKNFVYDMGPSWYWMPDVFETFFNQFGKSTSDYYHLVQLDPGFRMFFSQDDVLDIPANRESLYETFERIEPGSAQRLKQYLAGAAYKYKEGMLKMAYMPSVSWLEFARPQMLAKASRLDMFTSISKHVRKFFKDERLIALMEFPVLFLGAMPWDVPALYSLMNHAALSQGTWYPMGGMFKIVEGMFRLATSLGVRFHTHCDVGQIAVIDEKAYLLHTSLGDFNADAFIGTCDYYHLEQFLLEPEFRNYSENYWRRKTFAPSCLIYYLGINKRIDNLIHHNLFFDADLAHHAKEIYEHPQWPQQPLFYACCPSKTDPSVAPPGHENLFLLIPVATGLKDTPDIQEQYFNIIIRRMEQICGTSIAPHIVYKRSYAVSDFSHDYNAYKGNAYGLANTLRQTAILKPSIKNKKIDNLFYAGQLTVPGPGVPPAIISGQIAASLTGKYLNKL